MPVPRFRSARFRLSVLALLLGGALGPHLRAQMVYTYWDGGGTSSNLGTAANWLGNVAPTNDGRANVVFTDQYFAAGQGNLTPNLEVNYVFNTLIFAGNSSFTLGSTNNRGLNIGSGITQNSTAAQTISVPTFLTDDQTWTFAANAGALTFNSTANPNGQIRLQDHTLTLSAQGNNTLNGGIGTAGALIINGAAASTLTLTGSNNYTGGTTFAAGTLNAGSAGALGSSGTFSFTGGTLQYSASNATDYSGRFSTAANQAYRIDTYGQNLTFASALTSSGGSLTKLGAGTLTLAGANTYTGGTTVSAGTLALTGSVASGGNATLTVDGAGAAAATLSLSGNSLSTGNAYVGYDGNGAFTQSGGNFTTNGQGLYLGYRPGSSGVFTQSGGGVATGGGSLILGAIYSVNGIYHPNSGGTYNLSGSGSSLSTGTAYVGYFDGSGTFTQSGGSFTTNGQGLYLGYNQGVSGTYNLSGSGSSLSTGNVYVGYNGNGAFTQTGGSFTTNGHTLYAGFSQDITGYGVGGTYNLGGGTLTTGTTQVSANQSTGVFSQTGGLHTTGTLAISSIGVISNGTYNLAGGILNVGQVINHDPNYPNGGSSGGSYFSFQGGTLQASASSTTFMQGLTGARISGEAKIDTQGFDITIAQSFDSGGSLAGLTKLGSGALTLKGINTYEGPTTIAAGTLRAGIASTLGANMYGVPDSVGPFGTAATVMIGNVPGVALDLNGFNTLIGSLTGGGTKGGNVTLGGAALTVGSDGSSPAAFAGVISGSGRLTKIGEGALTLSGTNTYTGGTNVMDGTLVALNNGGALSTGTVSIASGATVALSNTTGTAYNQAGINFSGAGSLQKTGTGRIALGGNGLVNVAIAAGGFIDVQAGTLTGSSSYQADYTNNQGSLNIAAGATFNGAEGNIRLDALTGDGTLTGGYGIQGSTTLGVADGGGTFSGVIADSGSNGGTLSLVKAGAGTQVLTGNNTYTGGTTFAGGALNVGSMGALGSTGTLSFTGGTLQYSAANVTDYSSRFSQAARQAYSVDTNGRNIAFAAALTSSGGSLTKRGYGTLTLTGNNTYTGGTTFGGGTLNAGSAGALGSTGTLSSTGGTLQYSAANQTDYSARFSTALDQAFRVDTNGQNILFATRLTSINGGSLTKLGAGTLTLSGANTWGGSTTVSAGTLVVGAGSSVESDGGVTVDMGGAFAFGGSSLTTRSDINVGYTGPGTFTQSAGSVIANGNTLYLSRNLDASGTYNLSGDSTLSTGSAYLGLIGSGTFTQSGGSFKTNSLYLGYLNGSSGTYNLNGGTLNVGAVTSDSGYGSRGNGTFHFNGGTLQARASSASFFQSVTTADVQAGGAKIDTNGSNVTVAQSLLHDPSSGAPALGGGLAKLGAGTLTLTGANTYTGPTNVNAGTLLVNGASSGTGTVTVQGSGSVLGGTGTISALVNVTTGTLSPGNNAGANGSAANVGKLTVGALTLSSTATAVFDLSSGAVYDQLAVNGNITLGGSTLTLNVPTANATLTAGQVLDLFHSTGTLSGTFGNFADAGTYTFGGQSFRANYTPTDFTLTVTSVPEPATWVAIALLLGAMAVRRAWRCTSFGSPWSSNRLFGK